MEAYVERTTNLKARTLKERICFNEKMLQSDLLRFL